MKKGYIAISTVLVIGAISLVIGIAVTLFSISEGQVSLTGYKREVALDFVEGCIEDALLQVNTLNSITSTITIPEGTCSVTINSHVGTTWTFSVTGSFGGFTRNVQVSATRGTFLTGISWKEI